MNRESAEIIKHIDAIKDKSITNTDEIVKILDALSPKTTKKKILDKVINHLRPNDELKSSLKTLSKREIEVFRLIGLSLSSKEIGEQLDIKESTVSTHRKKINKKLNLSGRHKLHHIAFKFTHK